MLAQSIGISGRLEWLSEVCVTCMFYTEEITGLFD